jgi:hypothetical protein
MANIVVVSAVKRIAKSHGKRVGATYLGYLNRKLTEIVESDCRNLGSYKTLNSADANAKELAGALSR